MIEVGLHFWEKLEEVVAAHSIVIDRPAGTKHPNYPDMTYPVDYGYLDGTVSADGGGIDVFVGSSGQARIDGVAYTVDMIKKDAELKILLGCTPAEMKHIVETLSGGPMGALLVRREAGEGE